MTKTRLLAIGLILLVLNSGWLWAFAEPTLFYVGNVLGHIGLGVLLAVALVANRALLREMWHGLGKATLAVFAVCLVLGLVLCVIGATNRNMPVVVAHGAAGFLGVLLLAWFSLRTYPSFGRWSALALVIALMLPAGEALRLKYIPHRGQERVINPATAPLTMDGEGGGPESPFFPSSATTNVGGLIPSEFFLDSKACGECHKEIYEMWKSSMHHFSSFNNQFYRKSVEYMQETAGVQSSKWCAGCHDHAMFFNGRFERPVIEQIDTDAAQAGLGCMSCHSITHVPDTMGNGGFEMTYPPLHELMTSTNTLVRTVNKYVINTAPEAHRKAFMKPFMRLDAAEFCSTCHKVHLDVPVNNYRWFRGFNDYDAWHASGVSGYGARSFYYPAKSSTCVDCHMPLVPSNDPGNHGGFVHSHRFPGANTAVPYVNRDETQLKVVTDFLRDDIIGVDIFAISPLGQSGSAPQMLRRGEETPLAASTFASGEETTSGGPIVLREVGEIAAPIDRAQPVIRLGSTVKVDVVVRTKKIGHLFPTGTIDSFDIWLELRAEDATGRTIFWSGQVEEDGKGPVEKGAHFYQAVLLDEHGNRINKRNAFHARSVLYTKVIPPGAADTVHFRMHVPEDAVGPIRLHSKLNYRKFSHYYTQFAYAGQPVPGTGGEFGKDFDDREFDFSPANIPQNVSGQIKDQIPDLPIIVLAEDTAELQVGSGETVWRPVVQAEDFGRWNDFGIGMLLQGDLKGAEWAFQRVTEAKPDYADGWLNVARALIQEGQTEAARPYIDKALGIDTSLGRIHFFKAMIEKVEGRYEEALASLRRVEEKYPLDRVVLNQVARILFLQRNYQQALDVLQRVAGIDPEDLQMHYTAMLCYRGLGDFQNADREEILFERFKADEDSQVITASVRRQSPEDNNERQAIHEHVSVLLEGKSPEQLARNRLAPAAGVGGQH
jgi:Flp pilus assembly protein TadD